MIGRLRVVDGEALHVERLAVAQLEAAARARASGARRPRARRSARTARRPASPRRRRRARRPSDRPASSGASPGTGRRRAGRARRAPERTRCAPSGAIGLTMNAADDASRVPRDGRRHRAFVAGQAGDQHRPADAVAIELGDPAIGERVGRAGIVPAEPGAERRGALRPVRAAGDLRAEQLEEAGREEMAVAVVQPGRLGPAAGQDVGQRQLAGQGDVVVVRVRRHGAVSSPGRRAPTPASTRSRRR